MKSIWLQIMFWLIKYFHDNQPNFVDRFKFWGLPTYFFTDVPILTSACPGQYIKWLGNNLSPNIVRFWSMVGNFQLEFGEVPIRPKLKAKYDKQQNHYLCWHVQILKFIFQWDKWTDMATHTIRTKLI